MTKQDFEQGDSAREAVLAQFAITPAMIEAGIYELKGCSLGDLEGLVQSVYSAMTAARLEALGQL